jgi:hypothetical protein
MGILEDVLLNAKAAADTVGKKAGDAIDKSKLRIAILDIRAELSKKYRLLGRICYEASITGKNYEKSMKPLRDSITELNKQLVSIKDLLANADHKKKCSSCGAYNPKGALFCSKCGSRLIVRDAEEDYSQEELLDFAEDIMDEEDI